MCISIVKKKKKEIQEIRFVKDRYIYKRNSERNLFVARETLERFTYLSSVRISIDGSDFQPRENSSEISSDHV